MRFGSEKIGHNQHGEKITTNGATLNSMEFTTDRNAPVPVIIDKSGSVAVGIQNNPFMLLLRDLESHRSPPLEQLGGSLCCIIGSLQTLSIPTRPLPAARLMKRMPTLANLCLKIPRKGLMG